MYVGGAVVALQVLKARAVMASRSDRDRDDAPEDSPRPPANDA